VDHFSVAQDILYNAGDILQTPKSPACVTVFAKLCNAVTRQSIELEQWLSTFFVLVHTFKFTQKPVHPAMHQNSGSETFMSCGPF